MGQRSRKRRPGAAVDPQRPPAATRVVRAEPPPPAAAADDGMKRGYARSEARNQALREQLEPLAPGERPTAVTVAVILATALAVVNLALWLGGWEVQGEQPSVAGVLIFEGLMVATAVGMYRMRYWAVLGFEALLGISIVVAALSLLVATNVQGAILSTLFVVSTGTLFWFLVRAMARIQMPERPTRRSS